MSFNVGLKAIKKLCETQSALEWNRAKLSAALFKGDEIPVFNWVNQHTKMHHALPQLETLYAQWPETKEVPTVEPSSYYVTLLENRYYYEVINSANLNSQTTLKNNQDAHEQAVAFLQDAINCIKQQKYRSQLLDVGLEAGQLIMQNYHGAFASDAICQFGWQYMDANGMVMPGDVVAFVGRPAAGKTWLTLYTAIHNWRIGRNVLFVSMEMALLPITQRITAMYAHTNISQLKTSGYASGFAGSPYEAFKNGLIQLAQEEAKLYVVDGNLAASAEDIFILADQLKCTAVCVDGAYLLRHKNPKLDRFTRVAENAELIKRSTTDLGIATFTSWQLNREAVRKDRRKGEEAGVEAIAMSDNIGQLSSIVLGLFQEEGVETLRKRQVRVLKGRNGEIGSFNIHWNFDSMDFSEYLDALEPEKLGYI